MSRYLTKSRFKTGYKCPTKLHYLDNREYGNNNSDNAFLEALAEGGFQVGELAKVYHPGGVEITTTDKEEAAAETSELLKRDSVIIYEASFKHENLFVKADIVVKSGGRIDLIEVKAKSFDPREEKPFYTKASIKKGRPQLTSEWEPYIVDAAFQAFVFQKAHPGFELSTWLMLADKTAVASVEGLNQKFFLDKAMPGKVCVKVAPGTLKADLGVQLLKKVCVDHEIAVAWSASYVGSRTFETLVAHLSELCSSRSFAEPIVGATCKSCEFRIGPELKSDGLRSGFEKCWQHAVKLKPSDFDKQFVFEVWNLRKTQKLFESGKYFIEQLTIDDIQPSEGAEGLSSSGRQWLQVQKVIAQEQTSYFDAYRLAAVMKTWKFPLHFIDFETTMVAIPFNKGRRPYEQMAFQFSHHIVEFDGRIYHADQYLNLDRGKFPNFDFLRALKNSLSKDEGTIFRYAAHENTVLCQIRSQLQSLRSEVADADELISFIESITSFADDEGDEWLGSRNMVDMCELIKLFYYNPSTKGSNSIKKVLPAILNESDVLQGKYAAPIYGSSTLRSLNFSNWTWIQPAEAGRVKDPYKLLPPVFSDLDLETMDGQITDGSLADGGAAMTAYARMQFTEMSDTERDRVASALLKYCELDTFAMVLIYEHWKNEIEAALKGGK